MTTPKEDHPTNPARYKDGTYKKGFNTAKGQGKISKLRDALAGSISPEEFRKLTRKLYNMAIKSDDIKEVKEVFATLGNYLMGKPKTTLAIEGDNQPDAITPCFDRLDDKELEQLEQYYEKMLGVKTIEAEVISVGRSEVRVVAGESGEVQEKSEDLR